MHKIDGYNTLNKYLINGVFAHSFPFGNSQLQSDNTTTTKFIVMKISNWCINFKTWHKKVIKKLFIILLMWH